MQRWDYLTVYMSGALDFPDSVDRVESLSWAGKSLSHQLNEYAALGWTVRDVHWISDIEIMVIFQRPAPENHRDEE
ncbi:MAG: hypothetical protein GYB65_21370 [Chloroflexi bacterium]|nr:hypothetical protein [Chloroflexota bacterium]